MGKLKLKFLLERTVEKYRRLSDFNQRILDNAPVSVILINREGKITAVNSYFLNFTGSDQPVGRSIYDIGFFRREKLTDSYLDIFEKGKSFSRLDCRTVNRKGETKYLNIVAVPLRGPDGKIEGAISMAIDNTEAIEAKNNLKKITEELERKIKKRTGKLNEINRRLTDILDMKSRFVADASHELRNPLTVIQSNIDLAIMAEKSKKRKIPEFYQVILEEVDRMRNVLADLAILADAKDQKMRNKCEKICLQDLLKSVVRSQSTIAGRKKIVLSEINSNPEIQVIGDFFELKKLLSNIVNNAIKYTNEGGRVEIKTAKSGPGTVAVSVRDNGIGIPEKDLPHLFERYYRVDKARVRDEEGSGLGLSIAKMIATNHGGTINVSSRPGKGSVFSVYLPLDWRKMLQKKRKR